MNLPLRFVDARKEGHFTAMSLIHALGWRTTYQEAVPADYMAAEITDEHWVPAFREDYKSGRCHGLLLYRGDVPVACGNYGPARVTASPGQSSSTGFTSRSYEGWGEIHSFYTHPDEKGRGYGSVLMREILRRLKADGFFNAYVLVLRENAGARRFYERHGFCWDGTHEDIPFPPDTICVDLRYTQSL